MKEAPHFACRVIAEASLCFKEGNHGRAARLLRIAARAADLLPLPSASCLLSDLALEAETWENTPRQFEQQRNRAVCMLLDSNAQRRAA